jgi:hypothetical protein
MSDTKRSLGKELDKVEAQTKAFESEIKDLTFDKLNEAPKAEVEAQTQMSTREIANSKDIYLKPLKTIGTKEAFNEKFREAYNYDKEYVRVIAENRELIGESIQIWTKPYAGVRAEYWEVPTNKPVYVPRYLAEQMKRKYYHRLTMQEGTVTEQSAVGTITGKMIADSTIQRLDCFAAPTHKTFSMTKRNF